LRYDMLDDLDYALRGIVKKNVAPCPRA